MRILAFVATLALLASCSLSKKREMETSRLKADGSSAVVGGYFVEWGMYGRDYTVEKVPFDKLTHLLYAFLPICGPNDSLKTFNESAWNVLEKECADKNRKTYEVTIHDTWAATDKPDANHFELLKKKKKEYPHVTMLVSVGGWSMSDPFFSLAASPASRKVFIDSVVQFLKTHDFFDGVDIDWEFPGGGGLSTTLGSSADKANHLALMKELRAALDANGKYLLTSAVGMGPKMIEAIDYKGLFPAGGKPVFDHIFAMSYDYYGAWNGVRGHHSGLYPGADLNQGYSVQEGIDNLLQAGVPASRLSLGVAGYGRGWEKIPSTYGLSKDADDVGGDALTKTDKMWDPGVVDFTVLKKDYVNKSGWTRFYDEGAQAPFLWNSQSKSLITYEDKCSVAAKLGFAKARGLAGSFMWSLDSDDGELIGGMSGANPSASDCPCKMSEIPDNSPSIGSEPLALNPDFKVPELPKNGGCVGGLNPRVLASESNSDLYEEAPSYKERRLDQVSFVTAHNAFADNASGGWLFAIPNQGIDIDDQLENGVRGFMIDIYTSRDGEAIVCHVTCGLAGLNPWISLTDILKKIETFMYDNPEEIITIHFEMGQDPTGDDALGMPKADAATGKSVRASFDVFPGLKSFIFDPYKANVKENGWPKIKDMIKDNKRLLILAQQNKPELKEIGFAHDIEFTAENNWEMQVGDRKCFTRWDEVPLDMDRNGKFRRLFVMNHFNVTPITAQAEFDNTYTNIKKRIENDCLWYAKRMPNYIALDFVNIHTSDWNDILDWLNNDVRGIAYYDKDFGRASRVLSTGEKRSLKGGPDDDYAESIELFFEGTKYKVYDKSGNSKELRKSQKDLNTIFNGELPEEYEVF